MTQDGGMEAIERGLRGHFREQRQQFRAPTDLWVRIADRLEPRPAPRWRLPGFDLLRQVQPVYAGLAAALLVLVIGVATFVGPMLGTDRAGDAGPAVVELQSLAAPPAAPAPAPALAEAPKAGVAVDAAVESSADAPIAMAAAPESAPAARALAAAAPVAPELRFLALGDSYTVGHNVDASQRWTAHLVRSLRELGVNVADPEMIARTGWTTDELSEAMDEARSEPRYQLVTLLIGVNDQFRGRDAEGYRATFAALLRRAVALAVGGEASRVVVLSVPDWSVTPFAQAMDRRRISAEIERFNTVNREEAARAGARYVDITPMSREAESDESLLAGDGLHPSGKMYQAWMELALPETRAALVGE